MTMELTMSRTATCPECGGKSKGVKPLTLRALLKNEFVSNVDDVEYKFCNATGCSVVYFADSQTFTKDQLKVPVGVKETRGARPLCYCFGYSIATIKKELETKGRSDALDDIRKKMNNPGCRCKTENPAGACCLGSVTKGIAIATSELDKSSSKSNRAETITKVGTILSAIMASSCCWLPLLLILFGFSGAGIAGVLESYRPVFSTLTIGFLTAAFYFTYWPKQTVTGGAYCITDCCSNSGTSKRNRFNMMSMNKIMLWAVTVVAVVFMLFPNYIGFILARRESDEVITSSNPLIRTTFVDIEGMHCEGCTVIAEKSIMDVPGVLAVKVDYTGKYANIATESCCSFPNEDILNAIQTAGYTGKIPKAVENN